MAQFVARHMPVPARGMSLVMSPTSRARTIRVDVGSGSLCVALSALLKSGLKAHQWDLRSLRVDSFWSMVRRNDAKLATCILGVLVAVELGRIVSMLVIAHPGPAQIPAAVARPLTHRSEGVNVTDIVSAHLFGISVPEPAAQDPANAPRSTANLTLAGTIATEDPERGKAIIGDPDQPKVYSVGQQIGGAALRWVYLDHVVLDRNGSLETLALPHAPLAMVGGRYLPPHSAGGPSAGAPASATSENPVLDKIVDAEVFNNGLGQFVGIRVGPSDDQKGFAHSGLRNGDVIIAVNGSNLPNADRGQEIWKQVSTGTTVTVIRAGKQDDVTLSFAP